jgi:hypothetical protein
MHVSMVKLDIAIEGTFFCSLLGNGGLRGDSCYDLQGFILVCILYFVFSLVSNFRDHIRFK